MPGQLQRRIDRIGQNAALDRAVAPVLQAARRLVRNRRVKDALHGVWLGHPLHPALSDIPVGAWTSALILDIVGQSRGTAATLIGTGMVAAVPTAASGLADWSELHTDQRRVGLVHAGANTLALALYAVSLGNRMRGRHGRGRLFGMLGFLAAAAGAGLGGHLAFRLSAGPNHAERVPYLAPEGWQDVGAFGDLPDGVPVRREIGDISVVVVRHGGQVYALSGTCAHLDGPLYDGKVTGSEAEPCLTCPWHGSTFRLRDGEVVHGPATAPQPAMGVRVDNGRVLVRAPEGVLAGVTEEPLT